jgi:serine/threonine protein phosphatase PrpC
MRICVCVCAACARCDFLVDLCVLAAHAQAGGVVENDDGCHRVGGVLAVSRAIGDAYLKEFVICDPDVKMHKRRESMAFLVLGSDGLWDDVQPSDAAMVLGVGGQGAY